MTMIERVAMAMMQARDKYRAECGYWNEDATPLDIMARAAIEAMREPTETMQTAGMTAAINEFIAADDETKIEAMRRRLTEVSYQAMIDAALEPKS